MSAVKVFPNPSMDGHFYQSEYQNWEVYSIEVLKVLEGEGMGDGYLKLI